MDSRAEAFLRARGGSGIYFTRKIPLRGKPRECTAAGCEDAVVHGRTDQDMYRVNDFNDTLGAFARESDATRRDATCRYDATCCCDRVPGVTGSFHTRDTVYAHASPHACPRMCARSRNSADMLGRREKSTN